MPDALVGVLTAVASVAAAVGGLWLGLRSLRNKEHQAYREDLATVNDELAAERRARLTAEAELHRARLRLADLDDATSADGGGGSSAGGVGGAGGGGRDQPEQRQRGGDPGDEYGHGDGPARP